MANFSAMRELLQNLMVPEIPKKHWSQPCDWEFATAMAAVCCDRLKSDLGNTSFISASADEVTAIDNQQWLSVHVYFAVNFSRQSHLLCIRRLDDANTAANLTEMITDQLFMHGGLSQQKLGEKLICFGADGAAVFQGTRSGVIQRLKEGFAPFVIPMHDFAHRTNLAVEALSGLPVVQKLETLCKSLHVYFSGSPKRHLEFMKLAEVVETEGLKILNKVATRWISLLEPLKRICCEYKTLIVKFAEDASQESATRKHLSLLLDVATLLALSCILPLLEAVQSLIKFAQAGNVFISDFIAAVKICQADLYMMYCDSATSFQALHFQLFTDVVNDHSYSISQEWVTDLNNEAKSLGFRIHGHTYSAHMVDPVSGEKKSVSREDFCALVSFVKGQCAAAAELFISQLERRFPDCDIMEALGVIFPQYWLQDTCDDLFPVHLQVLKDWFCGMRSVVVGSGEERQVKQIVGPLDAHQLYLQLCLFKLTMKSHATKAMEQPHTVNPVTKLWQKLGCNALLLSKLSEYMKLAQIAVTAVLGSCEDERTFSTLAFVKNKVRNRLQGNLDTCICMFSQGWYSLESFPYNQAFDKWSEQKDWRLCADH
jgi:hypothetical protein